MADGEISPAEQAVLQQVFSELRFTQQEMELLMSRMRAEDAFRRHSWESHQQPGYNEAGLLADAYGVIGVSPDASDADVKITQKLIKAAEMFEIKLLDHVIIADKSYFSFADEGLIN